MKEPTKNFLRSKFGEYYRHSEMKMPKDFDKREWGFLFFDSQTMRRHKAFSSEEEALSYIREMVPLHAYYSSAVYSYPSASTMGEKEWLGADLIFDLDADHLPKAKGLSYAEMLERVKSETIKLIDFLLDDFGFERLKVVFSGGRGYHIHVMDECIRRLNGSERREVIDYLCGTGLRTDYIFKREMIDDQFKRIKRRGSEGTIDIGEGKMKIVSFDKRDYGFGWGKRVGEYLSSYMMELGSKDEEDAIDEIKRITKTRKKDRILKIARSKESIGMMKKRGVVDFDIPEFFDTILKKAIEERGVGVRPDEPVTCDTKRLIRLPLSLHGGSGFRVTPIDIDELERFDPLYDAIVFGEDDVSINVLKSYDITMKGDKFKIDEGVTKLPAYVAIFLMCRGMAEYEPRGTMEDLG